MSTVRIKSEDLKPLTGDALDRIASIRDEDIDFSDIPPINPEQWKDAVRGKFYRPRKESISLRVDCDVLHWFRSKGPGYQTRMNQVLREAMLAGLEHKTA